MSTEHTPLANTSLGCVQFPMAPVPRSDIADLARQQGVVPIEDPDILRGVFWPEEESIDDFLVFLRASRRYVNGA